MLRLLVPLAKREATVPTLPQPLAVSLRSLRGEQPVCLGVTTVAFRRGPVGIMGESGAGKGLGVRTIHSEGPRRDRPVLPAEFGALTPTLDRKRPAWH